MVVFDVSRHDLPYKSKDTSGWCTHLCLML